MISFYKIFIPQASELTGPLSNLLRKAVRKPLLWTEDLQQRFELLKQALSSGPVIKLPDPSHPFVLRTDASSHGPGAVLLQYYEDRPHPVDYASRKLQDRERRYSTIERECLALVYGIQRLYSFEAFTPLDASVLLLHRSLGGKRMTPEKADSWQHSIQQHLSSCSHPLKTPPKFGLLRVAFTPAPSLYSRLHYYLQRRQVDRTGYWGLSTTDFVLVVNIYLFHHL